MVKAKALLRGAACQLLVFLLMGGLSTAESAALPSSHQQEVDSLRKHISTLCTTFAYKEDCLCVDDWVNNDSNENFLKILHAILEDRRDDAKNILNNLYSNRNTQRSKTFSGYDSDFHLSVIDAINFEGNCKFYPDIVDYIYSRGNGKFNGNI